MLNIHEKFEKDMQELRAEKNLYHLSEYIALKMLLEAQYDLQLKNELTVRLCSENMKLKKQIEVLSEKKSGFGVINNENNIVNTINEGFIGLRNQIAKNFGESHD